jgi:hypothetical protein
MTFRLHVPRKITDDLLFMTFDIDCILIIKKRTINIKHIIHIECKCNMFYLKYKQ